MSFCVVPSDQFCSSSTDRVDAADGNDEAGGSRASKRPRDTRGAGSGSLPHRGDDGDYGGDDDDDDDDDLEEA